MFDMLDYQKYLKENPFYHKLGGGGVDFNSLQKKQDPKKPNYNVDPCISEPFAVEIDDLIRLHYLVTSRKVTTILEFGVGKSTVVFDDALEKNKRKYKDFVENNLRRNNAFECHSLDDDLKWIEYAKSNYSTQNVFYHFARTHMGDFNGRICTFYEKIPNICPDLIYLDAPSQFSPIGEVRGVTTAHKDRVPMAGDILAIEHFLLPRTLIVVDGRTANARFLRCNLQRNWHYIYIQEFDQHFFELIEEPLGIYNERQITFCLT